jgi:hypothetical protein
MAVLLGVLTLAQVARAQVESGPAEGGKAEPLKVAVVEGQKPGEDVDLVAAAGEAPLVCVFVRAATWDRPVARFLKTIDAELAGRHPDARVAAIWLTDDIPAAKEYLPRAQQSMKLTRADWTVAPEGPNGPNGWGINPGAHATAVVVAGGRVRFRRGYLSVNETDAPDVLKAVPEPGKD